VPENTIEQEGIGFVIAFKPAERMDAVFYSLTGHCSV
jgi:hypothetical protein